MSHKNLFLAYVTKIDDDGYCSTVGHIWFEGETQEEAITEAYRIAKACDDRAEVGKSGRVVYPFGPFGGVALGYVFPKNESRSTWKDRSPPYPPRVLNAL